MTPSTPFLKRKSIWIAVLLAAAGGYYFYGDGVSKNAGPPPIAVKVATVEKQDMPVTISQVGTVVANQSVAVRARLDSQIMEIHFKDGDNVRQNDLLFVLDDRTLKAQLAEEKANLTNLQAQYERTRALIDKKYVSKADLDQARSAYEAQKAVVDSISTQLEYTRITAPIDGRTGTINFTVGNTVRSGDATALVTINQIKPIRVQMSLPQQYLESVRQSMAAGDVPVAARHEGTTAVAQGRLEYIDNAVDQSSGTFAARALFPNDDETLWPGMFVKLEMTLGMQTGALSVPEVAIQHGQEGEFVFIIVDNKATKRDVKIARMQLGRAVIAEGVQEGDVVATDGLLSLKDGSAVSVNADKPPAP